ncbi:MAG TPA: glycosyltransferase [Chitinophagaceae bacterium]|jgi:cellulose synthase/poly-beta-1,6-N-acetylglucosamine synthase-like glycosyltransferase|nr:glycosyltransferase [Chitinophagaceae bacterium]
MLWLPLLLLAGYAVLIRFYYRAWKAVPAWVAPEREPVTRVSVVVAARNEAQNIPALVACLSRQRYPAHLFEVILVDDHSEDATAVLFRQEAPAGFRLVLLEEGSGKKKALETGIAAARGEWIVTTDADCRMGADWLRTMMLFVEERHPAFVAAPVSMEGGAGGLHRFQELDFLVLQGITAASVHAGAHSMCNGANLAYPRAAFYEVEGFRGIDGIASGDDMLLMHKIAGRYPGRAAYLKAEPAIVTTGTEPTLRAFLRQRMRWASKTRFYSDRRIFWVLVLVFALNAALPLLLAGALWNLHYLWAALALLVLKTVIEWPFVRAVAAFYGKKKELRLFPLLQPFHMLYTVSAGALGQAGVYTWKGRKTK